MTGRAKSTAFLLATSCLIALPSAAFAQQAPAPAADKEVSDDQAREIIVTGSRVATNGNSMPTPVTVVTAQDLVASKPTTLIDALNNLPVFSGSRGQQSNPISAGIAGAGSPASNQLNLRNLGAARTLVLFDGQRVAPTTIAGIVDADIIPQMLIQRVEVVTGGTSAVYGSDAVAGVVNFIPDKKFNGIKLQAQAGETEYHDNKSWKAGIAAGTDLLDGRAHIEASFEHYDNRGVLDRWSRPWNNKYAVVGTGAQSNPYYLLADIRNNTGSFGGLITNGVLKDMQFRSDGLLSAFIHGAPTATSTAEIGGDGYYQSANMVAPLKFDQLYVRGDLDIGDDTHAHIQFARDKKYNSLRVNWPALTGLTMSSTNAFLPLAYQQQLATAKQTTFTFGKILTQEPRLQPEITSDQIILNAGLDGKIGKFRWELSGNYGKTTLHNNFLYNQNNEYLAAALDAVVDPASGKIVCYSALTGKRPDCVPLNIFGPTSASQAALDYVFRTTHFTAHTSTSDINGSVSGEVFNTWAGPVSVALSGEWRRTSYDSTTDADATAQPNCATDLRYNCRSTTLTWANAFGTRTPVSVTVKEVAGEFEMPLLKDAPLAQSLSLNGALRYTHYSTAGSYWTWKAGLDWHLNDELRFRGTISRDIRAPTLNDLFAPATIQTSNAQDQLTGANPNAPSYRAGNPTLKSEIGRTKTFGIVYQPNWLPRFSLAVDAFIIEVQNAIVEIKGDDSVVQQACYNSGGTSPYCQLQTRPNGFTDKSAANIVTGWFQYNINISKVRSWGADVEANYQTRLLGKPLSLRAFLTWQPHTVYSQPGLSDVDMGGTAYGPTPLIASPSVRVTLNQGIDLTDNFRVDLQERYRNPLKLSGDSTLYVACCKVGAVAYVDLNLTYKVKVGGANGEVFFNVQNLTDREPPASAPPGSTTPGAMGGWAIGDDPLGRSFNLGFRLKL
ncbi:TonB-dependent receptor [Novosphingobium flavum]|uniref:TonB-dependent receptor n=1 Tax=Novosphingobium flavum TaxID=1778672 RepID=A0A7X1KLM7_9SPHN|nr:TonB-dependent receptor [Novosphingobium flavum]MBC2665385.1 TonB-dependent receptor [Novosphingobium flavum]